MGGTIRPVRDYYSTLGKLGMAKQREGDKKTPVFRVSPEAPKDLGTVSLSCTFFEVKGPGAS